MPVSAATCRVYATGTSTSMTTEACTLSGGNTVAQITNTAKRILDPTVTVNLYDNGVLQSASSYTLNHLFGSATKASSSWTGPVTMTANYLPELELDETFKADVDIQRDALDTTVFKSAAYKTCILGLASAAVTLSMLSASSKDFDSGAGTLTLEAWLTSGLLKVLELTWPGSSVSFRLLATEKSLKRSSQVTGRNEVTAEYASTAPGGYAMAKTFAFSDE